MFARVKRWLATSRLKRRACKAAREVFETSKKKVSWALVFAEEADSFIVLIAYGPTKPPFRAFYRVSKTLDCVTKLEIADLKKQYRIPVWR